MTGDQGYYEQLCEIISSHSDPSDQAEALEDRIRFEYDGEYSSVWTDLVNRSLARVNWHETIENNQEQAWHPEHDEKRLSQRTKSSIASDNCFSKCLKLWEAPSIVTIRVVSLFTIASV